MIDTQNYPSAGFRFFIYDPYGDFVYYRSAEDRDRAAEGVIDNYNEDGWDEAVEQIVAGEVTHSIEERNKRPAEPGDPYDFYVEYALTPIAPATETATP